MTKQEIYKLVTTQLSGQGNQVDLGSALPKILNGMLDGMQIESYTRDELLAKRNEGKLIPGAMYRITDYVATTIQNETRSANHPFDLIVTAVDERTLDAHAIATPHKGDHYFDGFHLESWDILYTIDNDDRYTWALTDHAESEETTFFRRPMMDAYVEDVKFYGYWDLSGERMVWFTEEIKQAGTYALYYKDGDDFATDEDVTIISFEESTGKGVIYHMVDEFGNERQFDFKGIQFFRSENWCAQHQSFNEDVLDGESRDWWFYAFSWITNDKEVKDCSLVGNDGSLLNDEGRIAGCFSNRFGAVSAYDIYEIEGLFALDNNVIVNTEFYDDGHFYGISGIIGLNSCFSNTFGNSCYFNTFGNFCFSNTFGNDCYFNTFGNYCYSNTFGNDCYFNTFGNSCFSNTFGNYCNSNTFGNYCNSNTFGNYCNSNTFGNDCFSNTLLKSYMRYIALENGVHDTKVNCTATTSGSNLAQNIHVNSGVQNKTCTIATTNNNYLTTFGSDDDVKLTV